MSIAIIGNTVVDVVFPGQSRLPSWPKHTEFTPKNLVFSEKPPLVSLGGNGANAAYVAARCGAEVTLHTRLGQDALGGLARRWLAQAGCRVSAPGRSATALNITAANRHHQRATLFYPGRLPRIPRHAPSRKNNLSHLLVCGWPHPPLPQIAAAFRRHRARGIVTALDVGPILGKAWTFPSLAAVFDGLDLFIANEYELRTMARANGLDSALVRLRRHFEGHVVIKRGPRGALWLPAGSDEPHLVPARSVKVISTVGAGDSFNGALLAALARGDRWPASLKAACATATAVTASPQGVLSRHHAVHRANLAQSAGRLGLASPARLTVG